MIIKNLNPEQIGFKKPLQTGFTLIELLVVVLIIGILSAVALPQYRKAVVKSRLARLELYTDTLFKASSVYQLANGTWPNDVRDLDIDITAGGTINETHVSSTPHVGVGYADGLECVVTPPHFAGCYYAEYKLSVYMYGDRDVKRTCVAYYGDQTAEEICKGFGGRLVERGSYYLEYEMP